MLRQVVAKAGMDPLPLPHRPLYQREFFFVFVLILWQMLQKKRNCRARQQIKGTKEMEEILFLLGMSQLCFWDCLHL